MHTPNGGPVTLTDIVLVFGQMFPFCFFLWAGLRTKDGSLSEFVYFSVMCIFWPLFFAGIVIISICGFTLL